MISYIFFRHPSPALSFKNSYMAFLLFSFLVLSFVVLCQISLYFGWVPMLYLVTEFILVTLRENSGCNIILIHDGNLHEWIIPGTLHSSYKYLSYTHRSDYLRCYFSHYYGGGYSDIKNVHLAGILSLRLLTLTLIC